jgi:hypothetical protein
MRALIRLLSFSKPYWLRIVVTTASLIAITLLSLIVPRLLGEFLLLWFLD